MHARFITFSLFDLVIPYPLSIAQSGLAKARFKNSFIFLQVTKKTFKASFIAKWWLFIMILDNKFGHHF